MPGTIYANEDFDAGQVAEQLRGAMKGLGTDEPEIIECMVMNNNEQRQEVITAFKVKYGKDLIEDIKGEIGSDFEEGVLALMMTPRMYDAKQINNGISGAGTDETTLIEIMCTRTNAEINEIKELYNAEFGSEMESDLMGDTSGYFRRMMVSLCAAGRQEDVEDDSEVARECAQTIYDAGEAQWGTDEAEINAVLCFRSWSQLRLIFQDYADIAGIDIVDAIKSEASGDLQEGLLAVIQSARNLTEYFADRIHKSVSGLGTSDTDLIRIIVSRSEIDLQDIKEMYQSKYDTSLADVIESECGGNYKRLLLAVIR